MCVLNTEHTCPQISIFYLLLSSVLFIVHSPPSPGAPASGSVRVKYCTKRKNNLFNNKMHVKSSLGPPWVWFSSLLTPTEQLLLVQMKLESRRVSPWETLRAHYLGIWFIFPLYGLNQQALFDANNLPADTECTGIACSPSWAINVCMTAYITVFAFG